MTQTVTIEEAKKDFSRLLDRVTKSSDEIVISEGGQPVARIVPTQLGTNNRAQRVPGLDAGQVIMSPDFDDPLPEEILRAFEGE